MNYWTEKHETLCKQWLTADTKQEFYIYSKLHGVLYKMSQIISNRYYSIPFNNQNEFQSDVIQEVFLRLKNYNQDKGSAYNFCGMIIKNKYYEIVTFRGRTREIQLEYIDNYEQVDNNECNLIDTFEQKDEIDVEAILKHLQTLRTKHVETLAQTGDRYHKINIDTQIRQILIIDKCIEYLLRFQDFNSYNVYEYVIHNITIHNSVLSNCFFKLFGISIAPDRKEYLAKNKLKKEQCRPRTKAEINHKWYEKRGKKRQQLLIQTEEYKAEKKIYYELHKEEIRAYKKAWRIANREKANQQSLDYYYRKKEENAKLLRITNNATPTDCSSSIGLLDKLPEHINTKDQENLIIGNTTKTCEMALVV